MVKIKSFKGIRPVPGKAQRIASRPYDVLNKEEARHESAGNPWSFLHVIKPEIDLPDDVYEYSMEVYEKGRDNFRKLMSDGVLVQDAEDLLYIYAQTMNGKTQYGLVACAWVEDYMNDRIKKHELTRPDKEEDRKMHVRTSGMNYEPVFFTYPANAEIDRIVAEVVKHTPDYDFTSVDGFGHHFWVVRDKSTISRLTALFAEIPATYVADGHHRTAAAALVGNERKGANPDHRGDEEYNFFLAVHFPDNQLTIIDYNRVIRDLNGLTPQELLEKLSTAFEVKNMGSEEYRPCALHNFSMYMQGEWYSLTAREGFYNDDDPIGCLDVTILSGQVLTPIFDITDLRKSKRIDFVGGIRGLGELKRRVDSGEMVVAFALYPVSMDQLIRIADTGNIMPPKTTWFEPKLRSGLVIHSLD
ncbi:MAG TPA: DUF1015 family protein [Bacteroidales bacterium]|nr:DUF1015 family protein [Bacteroidales bacterium]HRZ49937.1 DUF1015 family protein [Bacteroidales bacterium]